MNTAQHAVQAGELLKLSLPAGYHPVERTRIISKAAAAGMLEEHYGLGLRRPTQDQLTKRCAQMEWCTPIHGVIVGISTEEFVVEIDGENKSGDLVWVSFVHGGKRYELPEVFLVKAGVPTEH